MADDILLDIRRHLPRTTPALGVFILLEALRLVETLHYVAHCPPTRVLPAHIDNLACNGLPGLTAYCSQEERLSLILKIETTLRNTFRQSSHWP